MKYPINFTVPVLDFGEIRLLGTPKSYVFLSLKGSTGGSFIIGHFQYPMATSIPVCIVALVGGLEI